MGVVGMAPVAHELAVALDVTGEAVPSRTVSKTVHAGCVIAASREDGRRQRDQQRCAEDHQRGVSHVFESSSLRWNLLRICQTPRGSLFGH
jgi:hypothetical protein